MRDGLSQQTSETRRDLSAACGGRRVGLSVRCLRSLGLSEKEYQPVRSSRRCHDGLIRAGVFLIAVCAIVPAHTAFAQSNAGIVSSASGAVQIERGASIMAATPGTRVNPGGK